MRRRDGCAAGRYRGCRSGLRMRSTRVRSWKKRAAFCSRRTAVKRHMRRRRFVPETNGDYFAAHTTKTVTAQSFLDQAGATCNVDAGAGPEYVTTDLRSRLRSAILVYGTVRRSGRQPLCGRTCKSKFLEYESARCRSARILKRREELLAQRDVIFMGRPEANWALADWARAWVSITARCFRIEGKRTARNAMR